MCESDETAANDSFREPPPAAPRRSLTQQLIYGLSLPERSARSVSALVGGLLGESAARLIPAAFRSSRSYRLFMEQSLEMLVHDVGGVKKSDQRESEIQESQLAQKAVGGLLDVAGAATLHLSPLTVLAVFSDLAYGSGYYLKQLSDELKREGVIAEDSAIDHVSALVDALNAASSVAAEAMDTPPLNIDGFAQTIEQLRAEINRVDPSSLIPQAEIERLWVEMERAAAQADVGIWDVGATMTMFVMNRFALTTRGALSTVGVAGNLFDQHIIRHYGDALDEISRRGLYATLAEVSTPYLEAVWQNFASDRETWTAEWVTGRAVGRAWQSMRGWWHRSAAKGTDDQ